MSYQLSIPARINILGNPSDGNEGDFATISAAINLYARAQIKPAKNMVLELLQSQDNEVHTLQKASFDHHDWPLSYNGQLDLLKAGLNRLYAYSPELRRKLSQYGFHFSTWTEVPRQSGLGGSSLLVLLILGALRAFYHLDPQVHNDYVLAELAQRSEALEMGITCGYADRYVPLFGGLAYLDYRGKLRQQALGEEPFVTYEHLSPWIADLPLLAVTSGLQHHSGDVHGRMRPRYLAEHQAWQAQGGQPPPMVGWMQTAYQTAWRGKIALLHHDWQSFGMLMNQNHQAVDQMMSYCGFENGAGWANNLLIETALSHGALGAKLTGAGAGGSVFALVLPEHRPTVRRAWQDALQSAGLDQGRIFQPQIARRGLVVKET
ncbi:MAG: hypothetical protein JW862_11995 [Anaerolineales bacterium]|nr:hypothetical protein [Anaerolineales bacterium]